MDILENRQDITKLVGAVAAEQGIENHVITRVKINDKGEGYLGRIFMITVEDKTSDKKAHLVIKAAFTDEVLRKLVPIEKSFLNEIYFYTEVYPTFEKLEAQCGVSQIGKCFPRCFKTVDEKGGELLCLENLQASNFEVLDRTLFLDDEHVRLICQVYGRFHAYSFALRDQRPEEYARLVGQISDVHREHLSDPNGRTAQHLKNFSNLAETCLVPGTDDDVIRKYRKYLDDGIVEQINNILAAKCECSVIVHGDCWNNNMLFKYEVTENVKKIVDMRIIDMQVVNVSSPVCDLSFCLYSGASQSVMDNLDSYLEIYHESLSSFLKELGSDPEKLFPFEVLKEHWRKYSKFGMIMALAILKAKSIKTRDVVDSDKHVEVVDQVKFDEDNYRKRIRGLLKHLSEIDAL